MVGASGECLAAISVAVLESSVGFSGACLALAGLLASCSASCSRYRTLAGVDYSVTLAVSAGEACRHVRGT